MTTFQSDMPLAGTPEYVNEIARDAAAQTAYRTRSYMDHVDIIAAAVMKGMEGRTPAVMGRSLPMLFSSAMVRALLSGAKTQTRRILKPQPPEWATFCQQPSMPNVLHQWVPSGLWRWSEEEQTPPRALRPWPIDKDGSHYWLRPPVAPGDRIYVREKWQGLSFGDYLPTKDRVCDLRFAATDPLADLNREARGYPWRPGIHMPRWASRLTLIVTDVRIERLQDISEADAIAEGAGQYSSAIKLHRDRIYEPALNGVYREGFSELWEGLNAARAYGWDANPWVVAITFSVQRRNIDEVQHVS